MRILTDLGSRFSTPPVIFATGSMTAPLGKWGRGELPRIRVKCSEVTDVTGSDGLLNRLK